MDDLIQGPKVGDEILIVDDDPNFAKRLARAFEDRGLRVRTAHGCEEARKSFRSDPVHWACLLYTSPSPRDATLSRMPSSA